MIQTQDAPTQSDADKLEANRIIARQARLKSERGNTEKTWEQVLFYVVPRKSDILSEQPMGNERGSELFDSTAIMSNELLAAALHGMLTNAETRFIDLFFGDPLLDEDPEVQTWLQNEAQAMFETLNNTNFQTEIHEIYLDLGSIGMACLYMADDPDNVIHFSSRSMKEIFVDENNLGKIDVVHRLFKWTARQIIQEFGEKGLPKIILDKDKEDSADKFEIIHSVEPKSQAELKQNSVLKFKSVYLLQEQKHILSRSGYREFPYAVPRWTKTSGEKYGRGCGTTMLPDIRMVNEMMRTTLEGAQMTVRPPMLVEDDGIVGAVRMTPGGLTIVRPVSGNGKAIEPLITDARIDFGYQAVEDCRNRIRGGFYADQLKLKEGPQMTAVEVNQRTEETLRLMGPVLGRQHFEFLRPVIERLFDLRVKAKKVAPPPAKVKDREFKVRYSSMIARAQRMGEGQNLSRALSVVAPIVQLDPTVMDVINRDKYMKYVLEMFGIPNKIQNTDQELKAIRSQRQAAQQKAAQQQDQAHQADVAGKAAPVVQAMAQAKGGQNVAR